MVQDCSSKIAKIRLRLTDLIVSYRDESVPCLEFAFIYLGLNFNNYSDNKLILR
ncbi:hypothetical protein COCVIDRAFT_116493 [Bipolaris victoriae FI3]|uniref:Uncharacterized protein n=1 Tax=Bipolaris victoriae (strain FI3) TaxID=930091 RepID=W7DX09_BIPV3|nr:hypothetical protein COCVIDRAFT_116493 [Bipolaris victoriae FI3]